MTTRFADLGISVHTTGAKEGKSELDGLTGAATGADKAIDGLASSTKGVSPAMQGMTRKVNDATRGMRGFTGSISGSYAANIRMFAQQLSQVGQQGAATGNYFQALTLQAADMGAAFGVAGIAAGTLLTIMGPMAAELVSTETAAEGLADQYDRLIDVSDSLERAMDDLGTSAEELAYRYGTNAGRVREFNRALVEIRIGDVRNELQSLLAEFDASASSMIAAEREGRAWQLAMTSLASQLGVTTSEARQYNSLILSMQDAPSFEGQVDLLEQIVDRARAGGVEIGKFPDIVREILGHTIELSNESDRLNKMIEDGQAELGGAASEANRLKAGLSSAAAAALKLAGVNIADPISEGTKEAAELAANLNISLIAAINLRNLQQSMDYSGRGSDPRSWMQDGANAAYELEQGYKSVSDLIAEMTKRTNKQSAASRSASQSALSRLMGEISYRETLLDLTGDERKQHEALRSVHQRLGRDVSKYSEAQLEGLADRLVALEKEEEQMRRLADFSQDASRTITDALFNPDSAADAAKDMIRQIAYEFTQQRIVLPIVGQMMGVQGAIGQLAGGGAQAGGVAQSGGGLLSNATGLLGTIGGIGGAFTSGIGLGVSSLLGGTYGATMAGQLSVAATGSLTGIAGSLGAALPVIGAIAAAVSFFGSKTKLLDSGLRITVDNVDTLVESFRRVEKSRFWGLSKKTRETFSVVSDEISDPIERAIAEIQMGVFNSASALGVGSEAWDDFTSQFRVSTKGLSEDEAAEALQEALAGLSDEMAAVVPGLEELIRYGDTATATLTRLSTSLVAVNDVFDLLGHGAYEANIAGGALAAQLVDLFGGVDAMAGATNTYFSAFYTEAERLEIQTRRVSDAFGALGVSLPASREEFRALVEALDLTTSGGQEMYAAMLSLSGALDQVLPQVSSLTTDIAGIISGINGEIGLQMDAAREAQRNAESAARLWFRTAETLRDFIRDISGNSQLSGLGLSATHEINRSRFGTAFEMARGGDIDAASDIPALARSYLETARQSASTDLEYRRIAAQVQGQVAELGGIAALEGAQADQLRALHEQQIDVLTALQNYLNTSGVTEEGLTEFGSALDNLDTAISTTSAAQIQSLGAFGGSISEFVGSVGQVGDQIGIHLSDFVLGIPNEVQLDSNPLQGALSDLQEAIEADIAARAAAAEIASLQAQGATLASSLNGGGVIDAIRALEQSTGVDIRNGNGDAVLRLRDDGSIEYAATHVDYAHGANIGQFNSEFWGPGGLQSQIGTYNASAHATHAQMEALRAQIVALDGIPAFASGGMHTGGLRLVGENGPELEVTGPSRIYNASQTRSMLGGGAELAAEMQALRKEVSGMRSEQRQLGLIVARSSERLVKIERRRDAASEANA